MVIDAVATLALYCSRCGKICTHDVSWFAVRGGGGRQLTCSCGQVQATVTSACHNQYLLSIPCVVCEANHIICLDARQFGREAAETENGLAKIYCPEEHIELGFAGHRRTVDMAVAEHKEEIERMAHEMDDDDYGYGEHVENPQVMFEVLNKVHDIAERGRVYCRCGSQDIEASIQPETIELQCRQCGGTETIPAKDDYDLAQAECLERIEIIPPRRSYHRH